MIVSQLRRLAPQAQERGAASALQIRGRAAHITKWMKAYQGKLEGKEVPENILLRAQDWGFAYTMIKAYQGEQRDQF